MLGLGKKTAFSRSTYSKWRLLPAVIFGIAIFGSIIAQAFQLQVIQHQTYKQRAENQHIKQSELLGKRGEIYFQDLKLGQNFPVAVTRKVYTVAMDAKQISNSGEQNKTKLRGVIAEVFPEIPAALIEAELAKTEKQWYVLAKDIPQTTVDRLEAGQVKGLVFQSKDERYYPEKSLGAHILGFVSRDTLTGQYGIEQYYEDVLRGVNGFERSASDTRGVWLANTKREKVEAQHGSNILLTIDHTLQFRLEELLAKLADEYKTKAALGMLMDPKTGEVFAVASYPTFDLNAYNQVPDIQIYRNPLISNLYEQGSIFKPIPIGIALDKKLITPQTVYEDKGSVTINGYTIKNALDKAYGKQTVTFALEQSLNLGMIFVQQKIGNIPFMEALRDRFQLDQPTGIDLPGEVEGNINNITKSARDARDINYATASFGQGISFTPLKMLTAFNAIVNEGKMVKPRLVKQIISPDGQVREFEPEIKAEVMSAESARQLSEMLVSVIDNGGGKKAAVEGYSIGGKTGTAQIAGIGGYTEDTYQSFIEFATLDNPRYTLLISLDSPQGSRFADVSVVPNIKEFNQFLLNYFEIQPDRLINQ